MAKSRVLFVCQHNSARSRIAEAYLESMAGDQFEVESAGFEVAPINPLAIEVMREEGFDITRKPSNKVFDFFTEGRMYEYVITVCDESQAEQCPIFPGIVKRCHWSFEDPSSLQGTNEEKMAKARAVRDQIKATLKDWLATPDACGMVRP